MSILIYKCTKMYIFIPFLYYNICLRVLLCFLNLKIIHDETIEVLNILAYPSNF